MLRLAVPSDGSLHEASLLFLRSCGVDVTRTDPRAYTGRIRSVPGVSVNFQRASDIAQKVEEEAAEVGIVGRDRFEESRVEDGNVAVIIDRLGFGHADLVIGVPDSWVDVTSLADLADLSIEFRGKGQNLRVATKYPRLVERFLLGGGVSYFSLVSSSGTLEAAPAMGFADVIADISATGVTLKQNRLKTIAGGSVMKSEACLIANRSVIAASAEKQNMAALLVGRIEAHLQALGYCSITANMRGEAAEDVASYVLNHADISGLRGPTISKVYTKDEESWYAVTVIVDRDKLLDAVERFKEIGGTSVTVSQPDYVFRSQSRAMERLTLGA